MLFPDYLAKSDFRVFPLISCCWWARLYFGRGEPCEQPRQLGSRGRARGVTVLFLAPCRACLGTAGEDRVGKKQGQNSMAEGLVIFPVAAAWC